MYATTREKKAGGWITFFFLQQGKKA